MQNERLGPFTSTSSSTSTSNERSGPYTSTSSSTSISKGASTSSGTSTSSSKGTSKGRAPFPWSTKPSSSQGTSTSSSEGTSSKVPNFEALGQKGGKLRRIWELADIEARELQRSKERQTEACELMQQIFEMEKEYEEQQASRGSSSSNDEENGNASDSTECIYDEVAESS